MTINDIINKKRDYRGRIDKFKSDNFGMYVYTFINTRGDASKTIGKVVQVRTKAGVAGSDKVLIRHPDDSLVAHENQVYYPIKDKEEIEVLDNIYVNLSKDRSDVEYTLGAGNQPATGFIVNGLPKSEDVISFAITVTKDVV